MYAYGLVFLVAALITAAAVPVAARVARRLRAIDRPSDPRKVHTEPVPSMGGLAMLAGFLAAMGLASVLPAFRVLFETTSEPLGLLVGAGAIALVGMIDDVRELPPTVKLAGQILASLGPILFGIQIVYAWVPGVEVVALGPDLGLLVTVVALVVMINAVNLIDGLDGLAAGVVAIAAIAFFVFTQTSEGLRGADVPTAAPLLAAVIAGMSLGFLVHNFHPARIFMGDTGSMVLGLLLASAGVSYVGRSTVPSYADFAGSVPLLIPAIVLAIPLADAAYAFGRRALQGRPISMADKGHLHHLLITFGHSHRRAVLVLYYWSAVLAAAGVALALVAPTILVAALSTAVIVGVLLTAIGVRTSRPGASGDDSVDPRRHAV